MSCDLKNIKTVPQLKRLIANRDEEVIEDRHGGVVVQSKQVQSIGSKQRYIVKEVSDFEQLSLIVEKQEKFHQFGGGDFWATTITKNFGDFPEECGAEPKK